ncbi:MAG: SpoIIIAH-like family protein [Oscillospiraceae bacterium]|jgi:stage III sporulation protein AH
MKIWKRNMVIAAVILFVGTAVYLNWSYGQEQQVLGTQQDTDKTAQTGQADEKVLGQPVLVDGTAGEGISLTSPSASPGASGSPAPGKSGGSNYFASARLTRQQARDSAMSLLKEASEDDAKTAESIQTLANSTMAESRIENLVTAKGYADCVAFISENSISVVVATETGTLQETDVARIMDIVKGETAFSQNQIKIVPAAEEG